jgi:large subunit ribosomal protein L10
MNRDEKAALIDSLASNIDSASAIFAVDYRGISVAQIAQLRSKLRETQSTFHVVKNTLTERALQKVGLDQQFEGVLAGPTAFAFVEGDIAAAAKTISDFASDFDLLEFKGGLMEGAALNSDQFKVIAKLPSREVLYGQLVGMVSMPIGGVVRSLNGLIAGLASQLQQISSQELIPTQKEEK